MLKWLRRFFSLVGPGVITGAADDDPSGIATFSQTGAQFGYGQLWTVLFLLPMMTVMQEMCARIGALKHKGIAGVLRDHYPRPVLYTLVSLMFVANIINLGADLGAMAAAVRLLISVPFPLLAVFFAAVSLALQVYSSYAFYSRYLKWLSASLFAYVVTAFIVPQDWAKVFEATFIPHFEANFDFVMILVGLLGTTISPYLFFWQASEEAEEQQGHPESGERSVVQRHLRTMRLDTVVGMTFSQLAAWFILITAAGSLHFAGIRDVKDAAVAAKALEPLVKSFPHSGEIASAIFAIGIVGLGMLAVPVFAGSAAYAIAETFNWRYGLEEKPRNAPQFYLVMLIATVAGIIFDAVRINPMKALIAAAVINGVIAVPLILCVLLLTSNRSIMGEYVNGFWTKLIGWITFSVMALAAIAMLISFVNQ